MYWNHNCSLNKNLFGYYHNHLFFSRNSKTIIYHSKKYWILIETAKHLCTNLSRIDNLRFPIQERVFSLIHIFVLYLMTEFYGFNTCPMLFLNLFLVFHNFHLCCYRILLSILKMVIIRTNEYKDLFFPGT